METFFIYGMKIERVGIVEIICDHAFQAGELEGHPELLRRL